LRKPDLGASGLPGNGNTGGDLHSTMTAPPLYTASVPVFRHYLGRAALIAERSGAALGGARLADSMPADRQFATAAGFALRIACPLTGREIPHLPQALAPRLAVVRALLGAMRPAEFDGAETRLITHQAGFAELTQDGASYLHLYGMPNFLFHIAMGYGALRAAGMPLGKADFDGFHSYPEGFSFDAG
jgi:hypothetical protein